MNSCAVCKQPSEKKCSLCGSVFYCSREHQKLDWKTHKSKCVSFKVEENETLGRFLVASRRITNGEEILKERPLVSGPLLGTPPVCLGCYSLLTELNHVECPKCGWPMCSIQCAKSVQHYPECRVTAKQRGAKVKIQTFQINHPSYDSLTVLRCICLRQDQPETWAKFTKLQSHCNERKGTEKYERDKTTIAKFIQSFFKLDSVAVEEILRVLGIIYTNGHEVPISGHDFVSIYDTASYLEHNCHANCSKSFTSNGELMIRSARVIEAGEHLSICYTDPLWGTASRRQHLSETKFFSCTCKRCTDPTELNTHFSSLKCQNGTCRGFVIPVDPFNEMAEWKCQSCQSATPIEDVFKIITNASTSLANLDKCDIKSCNSFMKEFERCLHRQHYFLTDVKLAITQILDTDVSKLSDDDLNLKLRYCKTLSNFLAELAPAENRSRGVLLFGLHAAIAEIGRRKSTQHEMDAPELKNNLLECKDILSQAYQLLRHEPDILPEGQIAQQAKRNLKDIERILQTLHATMGDNL